MVNHFSSNNGQLPEKREFGILQWFHLGDYDQVEQTLQDLKKLKVRHLRTGISWADYYREGASEWYDWLLPRLAQEVTLLPCFLYTPPSIGLAYKTSSPPQKAKMYADFLDVFINRYGEYFEWVELWNEPNNRSEYDYTLDPNWSIFGEMIIYASYWCRHLGKKVALGGMSPVDCNWLDYMAKNKVLEYIDAVGIHGFPDTFDSHFLPWDLQILEVKKLLEKHQLNPEVWITEAGYSTWKFDEKKQLNEFRRAINSTADRVYWYSLYDLSPEKATVDGFHLDEREYYFGLITTKGRPKLLFRMLELYGADHLQQKDWWEDEEVPKKPVPEYVLITGGAGFVGVNLADHLLRLGHKVIIYDNLSRLGVEENLQWLLSNHDRGMVWVEIADTRNAFSLQRAVAYAKAIFHLAAQVAVTTSLVDPANDFEINIKGTFNLLEAIKNSPHRPPLVFTSTNKVYGDLNSYDFEQADLRYLPQDLKVREHGVDENQPLDFQSPYGVSKGAAEQYVLDYARSFDLKAVVFRMSCIYGPRQFGTEDQGWVAHFVINTLKSQPIFIYGDGKQVRDILYVGDLVHAFQLAWENIEMIKGNAYNIGGGPQNAISLLELVQWIGQKNEAKIDLKFGPVRTCDQVYYVSDFRKFEKAVGWTPKTSREKGLEKLHNWLLKQKHPVQDINLTNTIANE